MFDWIIGNVVDVIILSTIFSIFAIWIRMSGMRKPVWFLLSVMISGYGIKLFDNNLIHYLKNKFSEFSLYMESIVFFILFLMIFFSMRRVNIRVRYTWWRKLFLAVVLTGVTFPYVSLISNTLNIYVISTDLLWYFNSSIFVSIWYAMSVTALLLI